MVLSIMTIAVVFLAVDFFAFQEGGSWWVWFSLVIYALFIVYYVVRYRRLLRSIDRGHPGHAGRHGRSPKHTGVRHNHHHQPWRHQHRRGTATDLSRSCSPPSYTNALTHPNRPDGVLVPDATMLPPPPTYDEVAHVSTISFFGGARAARFPFFGGGGGWDQDVIWMMWSEGGKKRKEPRVNDRIGESQNRNIRRKFRHPKN